MSLMQKEGQKQFCPSDPKKAFYEILPQGSEPTPQPLRHSNLNEVSEKDENDE